jgi:hypothetical protein
VSVRAKTRAPTDPAALDTRATTQLKTVGVICEAAADASSLLDGPMYYLRHRNDAQGTPMARNSFLASAESAESPPSELY